MTALDTLNVQKEKLKKLALRDKNVEKYLQSIENGEVVSGFFYIFNIGRLDHIGSVIHLLKNAD